MQIEFLLAPLVGLDAARDVDAVADGEIGFPLCPFTPEDAKFVGARHVLHAHLAVGEALARDALGRGRDDAAKGDLALLDGVEVLEGCDGNGADFFEHDAVGVQRVARDIDADEVALAVEALQFAPGLASTDFEPVLTPPAPRV